MEIKLRMNWRKNRGISGFYYYKSHNIMVYLPVLFQEWWDWQQEDLERSVFTLEDLLSNIIVHEMCHHLGERHNRSGWNI